MIFGAALMGVFRQCGYARWAAWIPFYNLWLWTRLSKNPGWLLLLLPQVAVLPHWAVISLAFFVFFKILRDTHHLFQPLPFRIWIAVMAGLAMGLLNLLKPDIPIWINLPPLVAGWLWIAWLGYDPQFQFDRKRYFARQASFRHYVWRQFQNNRPALLSAWVLGLLAIVAINADYLANDQPLYARYKGETVFPAYASIFNPARTDTFYDSQGAFEIVQFDIANWKRMPLEAVAWTPVAYAPDKSDIFNRAYTGPFDLQRYKNPQGDIVEVPFHFRHHLGTDGIGQDVLSGLIHGSRISLSIGILSMGIAAIIGILLGALAGFYGDTRLRAPVFNYALLLLAVFLALFYAFDSGRWLLGLAVLGGALVIVKLFGKYLPTGFLKKEVRIPVDAFVSRGIEVLNSLPILILIITISAISERSIVLLMVIIGVVSWTGIARFTRAEFLRIRNLEYVQASRALGFSEFRMVARHALPNALPPVFVPIAFGIAAAILVESGLSFLGIGVPDDVATWGAMLSKGRQEFEAWWLVIFPGLAIFLTVTIYNLIGDGLRDALDPRLKQ